MARKSLIIAAAVLLVPVTGCSSWFKDKDDNLPKISLPAKPTSQSVPCEDLSAPQESACLKLDDPQARDVCRKAQKNKIVCDDVQQHVDRLYEAKDGK